MPQVRKLAPEEVQQLQPKPKGQRKLIEEQYDAILSEYAVGDYGEALLEPEDNRRDSYQDVQPGADAELDQTEGDAMISLGWGVLEIGQHKQQQGQHHIARSQFLPWALST
jgi:hypothetical protein